MLENYVRISVGTPEENDKLIAALKEITGRESSLGKIEDQLSGRP